MPDIQDPSVKGTCRVVFEAEICGVGGESAYGIEVVRVNGRLCRALSCKDGHSHNGISFAM